jgi:glycosyltransferase involved in cell wall biosynthesis
MNNGNTMKNVLIVSYIFPPLAGSGVQRTLKFVNYLRSFGWEPIVVTTGQLNFPQIDYTLIDEIPKDVQVIRIKEQDSLTGDDLQNIIKIYDDLIKDKTVLDDYLTLISGGRAALVPDNCISWANNVIKQIDTFIDINKIDMIYTTSGPYSDHIVGYYLKKKFNKPWVADFRDEWTNNAYSNVDKQSLLYKVHYGMEETIVNSADAVIATTPLASDNYATIFDLPKDKVFTITNGYDEKDFEKIEMENLEIEHDKFTIIHNGLLYLIRTPDTFLNAIHNLIKKGLIPREKIRVQFTGTKDNGKWEKYISDLKLDDIVEFSGYLSHKESLKKAASADILLLIVGPGEKSKSMYPGKIFEYLRLGKPIISLSPIGGVVDELIKKTNRGYNVDFHDISAIEEAIYELYNKWNNNKLLKLPVNSDIRQFERRELTRQLVSVFHKVLAMQQIKKKNDLISQDVMKTVKHFLELGNIEQAKQNINHNLDLLNIDAELCTMKAVIEIMENKLEDAEITLKKARKLDITNVDVLYNLGYIYEQKRLFNEALYYYEEALKYTTDQKFAEELKVIIQKIRKDFAVHLKKRIAFFAIPNGGDKFLGDIIAGLSDEYEIKKFIVYDLKQIDKGMEWADICWFEWCDQLIAYGSRHELAKDKKIICRIHRYEVFTENAKNVNWLNVDRLILVTNHLLPLLEKVVPNIKSMVPIELIENGVDINKYSFRRATKGYKLAFVGDMIHRKNPVFMLQIMKKLVNINKKYQLYIAGQFQDPLIKEYWEYQVKELNLEDHIHFEGFQDDVNRWLEDKDYILATTIHESFGFFIAEAMAKGIKPIIHNFLFSKEIWDERYLFNTIDEAVQMIESDEYNSEEYRRFIESNYSLDKQIEKTKKLLNNLIINKDKSVIDLTIGM